MSDHEDGEPVGDVTRLLQAVGADRETFGKIVELVYDELCRMARNQLVGDAAARTLDATALVHEAYLRLVDQGERIPWKNRRHFFAAAAEAMKRIRVDSARRRRSLKRGGGRQRRELALDQLAGPESDEQVIALSEALERLAARDPTKAEFVTLRIFGGLTIPQAAQALGISTTTADRYWAYARAWLRVAMTDEDGRAG
jgi:RNA polymerase sigma factor (TIGR02999 family)